VADYALKYPRQVEKLVFTGAVMNPLGYRAHDFLHKSLLGSLRRGGAEALFDHYYPLLYTSRTIQAWGTPGYLVSKSRFLENNPAEMLERHLAGSVKLKFDCEQLRKLTMPALFISGEDDPMTRPCIVSLLTRRMAKARAVYIPNSGHNPYIETPVEFQNAVYTFMADKG
jgi:pimeloyl-ACP methyl ester carboxylesterase